ncbi:hypothetical protein GLAREA_10386 [Glarea lozoyensis ATCC 20868]|uniref:RNI-like protein n=1 Tax=Glarea lozoyensis (strain ATCC 20868 / MF5171) TaxID=1116229 RepID=S3D864_GLAL2|nr:uncharacterized protein GLAREA_10386 [Glarea lozoyensis ATCC 20868]EPE34692.1 hypothetical protein GLAREA_10386 [Glarea lozoyensis ATCC 20868]
MALTLESLDLLVLERICEYLDSETDTRRDLWAFSLTSRCCYTASAIQRLCQIKLNIPSPDQCQSELSRWDEILNADRGHRHVRRLKVTNELRNRTNGGPMKEDGKPDNDITGWRDCSFFDVQDFCHPPKDLKRGSGQWGDDASKSEAWVPLAHFIQQLSGLQDLVWSYGYCMPAQILFAIASLGCRLHMHEFRLWSLIQPRDSPQPIDADEYALLTSPYLYSIVIRIVGFAEGFKVDYSREAVIRMIAGVAPNLAHVQLVPIHQGVSLELDQNIELGKPPWRGFFLKETPNTKLPFAGKLRSLVFDGWVDCGLEYWASLTDFSYLRCLDLPWNHADGITMAQMAIRGCFKHLHTLKLGEIEDESDEGQKSLTQFFENIHPLRQLRLSGYINSETFDVIVQRHGRTLLSLEVSPPPRDDVESKTPPVAFNNEVVQRLADLCPNLEQISIPLVRTRGDAEETGIYRALRRLPRLRCALLRLSYTIGPEDDGSWDEGVGKDDPPAAYFHDPEDLPPAYLREVFSNIAVDETLALSIFNTIASGGSLKYLKLEIDMQCTSQLYHTGFLALLRWFSRSWILKRDVRGKDTAVEIQSEETARAGEEWIYQMSEEGMAADRGEEVYVEAFKALWPQKTKEWWNDWTSLPLSNLET